MKSVKTIILTLVALFFIIPLSWAQKNSTIHVKLLNNKYKHVDLVSAYGEDKTYLSADIEQDQFTMTTPIGPDIYRLRFDNQDHFLLVVTPGEFQDLELDAENMVRIVSTSGSPSMAFVKKATDYGFHRKNVLDSLNNALQHDDNQKYWATTAQSINMFTQTNDDVDNYLMAAFRNVDSLLQMFEYYAPGGKLKSSFLDLFVNIANKQLKGLDMNYQPFANYQENADKYYDFSQNRQSGKSDFYYTLDNYIDEISSRHNVAASALGSMMKDVKELLEIRDSLAYNNLMDKKSNKNAWANMVLQQLGDKVKSAATHKSEYEESIKRSRNNASALVTNAQDYVRQIVARYQDQYNETDAYVNNKIKEAVLENKNDIASVMFVDMFPREQNPEFHKEVFTALHDKYPNHPIVAERWSILNAPAGKSTVGAIAPELEFPNPDGKMLKLSDLRGKIVLVDFWASWCGPCRRENPNVRRVYSLYHDKGFEIFSVSLDRDANAWKGAILADQLVWPNHVSDLKQWQSQAAAIYGVRSIPATFLLDREGRIVAKDLRGEALERAVKQLVEQ
ncbi:MAG: redoxin domain-containing protein [Bacteroidales bacterium]|nr:redoxin domain-containing protein [Bacteroidales bacterium]